MTSIQRVVSIGAHSLDAELMGGPLILKYARQGAHCTLIHVTQGRLEDPAATEEAKQALNEMAKMFNGQTTREKEQANEEVKQWPELADEWIRTTL